MTARRDIALQRGDTDPPVIWQFDYDLDGSAFTLTLQWPEGALVRGTDGAGLTIEGRTVIWLDAIAQTEAIPPWRAASYKLRRIIAGKTRLAAHGTLTNSDVPMDLDPDGAVRLVVPGSAGPRGATGPAGRDADGITDPGDLTLLFDNRLI